MVMSPESKQPSNPEASSPSSPMTGQNAAPLPPIPIVHNSDMVASGSVLTSQPAKSRIPSLSRMSLRTKATLLAMALGALPVMMIGGAAYVVAGNTLTEKAKLIQTETTVNISGDLNRFMFERYGDVQAIANLPVLRNQAVQAIMPLDERQDVLDKYINIYGVYDSIAVFDLNGNPILQSTGPAVGNHKDFKYFQQVVKTDRPAISAPREGANSKDSFIFMAAPVKDATTNKTIAIVRTRMPLEKVEAVIRNFATGSGKGSAEGDNDYHIYDIATNKIFIAADQSQLDKEAFKEFSGLETAIGKSADGTFWTLDAGKESLLAYTKTPDYKGLPNLNWGVVYAQTKDQALQAQTNLLQTLEIGVGLGTLALALIGAAIASRATRPIKEAADTVNKIGQGDLGARLGVKGQDELATLGQNINSMATRLQVLIGQQEEEARLTTALAATSLKLRESFEAESILNMVVREAMSALEVDRVVVYRFNPDWTGKVVAEAVQMGWPQALHSSIEDNCLSPSLIQAYREGRVNPINDVYQACLHPEHVRLMERLKIKSNLITPVMVDNELYAFLVAHHCAAAHTWQRAEIDFLSGLAQQASYALDQAQFVERIEDARVEARADADASAMEQRQQKEFLQKRALELLMEVDPVSKGDLTIRATVTPDEVGTIADSYNSIIRSLRQIVEQVQSASGAVSQTAESNEVSVSSLSQEAQDQMQAISVALYKIDEMSRSIEGVSQRAQQAREGVQIATQTIAAGDLAMDQTVAGISSIRETVSETAKKVKRLGEASQKISKVVNLIGDFAAQTNLLALNAAIEAARAGEEGRGFAVVAEEVRALAQQSAAATAEIEQLVEEIQTQTNEVVTAMEDGTDQVVQGTKLVEASRQQLSQISEVSRQINTLVKEISVAAETQTETSNEVAQTMQQVAAIANSTSERSINVADSFTELVQVARSLQVSVSQFKM
jgi:methyl-accepting chemotaxis protein PixJ